MCGRLRAHLQEVLADLEGVNLNLRLFWLQDRNGCLQRLERLHAEHATGPVKLTN